MAKRRLMLLALFMVRTKIMFVAPVLQETPRGGNSHMRERLEPTIRYAPSPCSRGCLQNYRRASSIAAFVFSSSFRSIIFWLFPQNFLALFFFRQKKLLPRWANAQIIQFVSAPPWNWTPRNRENEWNRKFGIASEIDIFLMRVKSGLSWSFYIERIGCHERLNREDSILPFEESSSSEIISEISAESEKNTRASERERAKNKPNLAGPHPNCDCRLNISAKNVESSVIT